MELTIESFIFWTQLSICLLICIQVILSIELNRLIKRDRKTARFLDFWLNLQEVKGASQDYKQLAEFMICNLGSGRLAWRLFIYSISAKLRSIMENPKGDAQNLYDKIQREPPSLRDDLHGLMANFILELTYSARFILVGAFLRRISFFSITKDKMSPVILIVSLKNND